MVEKWKEFQGYRERRDSRLREGRGERVEKNLEFLREMRENGGGFLERERIERMKESSREKKWWRNERMVWESDGSEGVFIGLRKSFNKRVKSLH